MGRIRLTTVDAPPLKRYCPDNEMTPVGVQRLVLLPPNRPDDEKPSILPPLNHEPRHGPGLWWSFRFRRSHSDRGHHVPDARRSASMLCGNRCITLA